MKTNPRSMLIVVFCTLITALAQILYKLGADRLEFSILSVATNWQIIVGLAIYSVAAVLLVIALKDGELSVLYPIISLNYIWVSVLSSVFLNEAMSAVKWSGIAFIILGVSFIGVGSGKK